MGLRLHLPLEGRATCEGPRLQEQVRDVTRDSAKKAFESDLNPDDKDTRRGNGTTFVFTLVSQINTSSQNPLFQTQGT